MNVVNSQNFEQEVLQSTIPVLVDFGAPWCPPCRTLLPILESISEAASGRYKIVKLNIDDCIELAEKYSVSAIPALLLFKDGKVDSRLVGMQSKQKIEETLA